MFHFKLYNDERLVGLNHKEKQKIISKAMKAYRKQHPVDLFRRLTLFACFSIIPSIVIYLLNGQQWTINWFCVSGLLLSWKLAHDETPAIMPFLSQVLAEQ